MNLLDLITDFCSAFGYELLSNYSNESMHNKSCVGILCGNKHLAYARFKEYLVSNNIKNIENIIDSSKVERYGMEPVIYFPRVSI